MIRALSLGVVLAGLWLLLSGYFAPMLLGFGLVSVVLVTWLARRMDVIDREGHPLHLIARAPLYWAWLALEVVKSNLDVARRILDPRLPIDPAVVRLPAEGLGAMGKVVYGNSVTLTPGTVTLNVEADTLEVHALTREAAEALRGGDMARRVARVTGRH